MFESTYNYITEDTVSGTEVSGYYTKNETDSGFVTLGTIQTISGTKTFLNTVSGSAFVGDGSGITGFTLDDAYNNDSGERTILVDDGDISFDLTGNNNFIVDVQGSGWFEIQDSGAPSFRIDSTGAMLSTLFRVYSPGLSYVEIDHLDALGGYVATSAGNLILFPAGDVDVVKNLTISGTTTFGADVSGITLNELDDVNAVLATNGQVLHYEDGNWIPTTLSGATEIKAYFDGYDSTGGTDISSGWTDVPLDTNRQITPDFEHTVGFSEVTCRKTGSYVVIGKVTIYQSTGNSRSDAQMRLTLDTGSGFQEVDGTYAITYSRNNSQGQGTMVTVAILDLEASNAIRMQAQRYSGTGTLNLFAEGSSLLIFPAIGQKGDKGEKGDPGSGASIIVKDNGVTISGSPSEILNFEGFDIDDTVSGTATVKCLFGSWYGYTLEEDQSSTSSTSWQQKARFSANAVPTGIYRVAWYYEWNYDSQWRDFQARVQVDDTTTLAEQVEEPADSGSDQWHPASGFGYVSLAEGNHYVDIDYRASDTGDVSSIRNARIEFWRFS